MSHISLHAHIVFATKDRTPLITPGLRERLFSYIGGVLRAEGCSLLAAGGTADHVHLLVSLNAVKPIADLMRTVKAGSSRWAHETFGGMEKFAWQEGSGLFSVSYSNIERVKEYIGRQEAHHRQVSFREELIALLKKHNVTYNERYV
jgi:REP element-mobilizing transposase RayT